MKIFNFIKIVFCVYVGSLAFPCNANDLSEVACRYETKITLTGKKHKPEKAEAWYFWRKADTIQTRDADGDHGEIWVKTGAGVIQYRTLYHEDKTAVEFMPADQPTNNLDQDWFKLSSMFSQEELETLKTVKKTKVLGRSAEIRKGEKDGKSLEVVWLIDEQLPASIVQKDHSGSIELRLTEIEPLSESQSKPVPTEEIANYRHIDAVDFGDMENDPFVKKVMAEEGYHHH